MFIIGDNRRNNNVLTKEKEDNGGVYYKCKFYTSLSETPEVVKTFYAPKVGVEHIYKAEKDLLSRTMLGLLNAIFRDKKVIIGLGPGRCGSMSLALFFAAQPIIMSHHESNPKLRWDASVFEFIGKWADLFHNVAYDLPVLSDVAFWYLPFVDYIKYVCPNTKFVCMRRDTEKVVESFMLKYFSTSAWTDKHCKHWRPEWIGGNPFLDSFPSYDLPKEAGCRKYVQEYYETAEELERKYAGDFKIFNIGCLNTVEGKNAILEFCGIPEEMRKIKGEFRTNITGGRHAEARRIWKEKYGEES